MTDALGGTAEVSVSWPQALAWRLRRQLLDPVGDGSVADVVRALAAVPAYQDVAIAVGTRRARSRPDDVARAVAEGEVILTFAFRGATHLMTPEDGGVHVALRASSRMWELPSWQEYYGLTPADWPPLRQVVRDALADGPLTTPELAAAVTAEPAFRHLEGRFDNSSKTLLKAFAWQGDLCLGRTRDGVLTVQRLDRNPRWAGIPDLDEAGPRAVELYVRAYGPTTPGHLRYWLGEGLGAGRGIRSWVARLGARLAVVDVDGEPALVLREDVDELAGATASTTVRLLPGHDQWVLGPGTKDQHVVPPDLRTQVTRGAGLVVVGGVVQGTWSRTEDEVRVDWLPGARPPAPEAVADEVARLGTVLDRPLSLAGTERVG